MRRETETMIEPEAPAGDGGASASSAHQPGRRRSRFQQWLLEGHPDRPEGLAEPEAEGDHGGRPEGEDAHGHKPHSWPQVMCLTGVDYFSTLGYQPGIAALAAGALSPIATLILVLLTLFGALPIYRRVAAESPHGEGSISMLERLLPRWGGKLFVLVLLGFVATDFIITITLSAADATAHVVENPLGRGLHDFKVLVTLGLIALLGGVFLKGFKEAIGIAVVLVGAYLGLNAVVIGRGLMEIGAHPQALPEWRSALFAQHGSPLAMIGVALLLFPRLALGLSGFETGVAVMPLVKGAPGDTEAVPTGRITNTRKLLGAAAAVMSVFLLTSSLVTTLLIPSEEFRPATHAATAEQLAKRLEGKKTTDPVPITDEVDLFPAGHVITPGDVAAAEAVGRLNELATAAGVDRGEEAKAGEANGRALAFLAHKFFGEGFGTAYDLSTILILWFAGASAMAGLLNIVPRYLPRYGMAPDWTRASRPLVIVFTAICFAVTVAFRADVDAQGGAYATGVLVLMTSAAVAVTLSARRMRQRGAAAFFALIALVFAYTTAVNVVERTDGIKIASLFIGAIVVTSLVSRVGRSTELRVARVEMDALARLFVQEAAKQGEVQIIANRRQVGDIAEYRAKERSQREDNHIPRGAPVLFLEVDVADASEFAAVMEVKGAEIRGEYVAGMISGARPETYRVLRARASAVPNAIAALLLHIRDLTGKTPHCYLTWSEGNPLLYVLRFVLLGEGDTPPLTNQILRNAEPVPEHRPALHVGGWS